MNAFLLYEKSRGTSLLQGLLYMIIIIVITYDDYYYCKQKRHMPFGAKLQEVSPVRPMTVSLN